MSGLKVYSECCQNCLLSPDRIVSPKRAKEIIQKVVAEQSYFICHKSSMNEGRTVCATFYKTLGYKSQLIRIMERLNGIELVPQDNNERLPSYAELKPKR